MHTDKQRDRYRAQRGDLIRIPSPFSGNLNRIDGSTRGLTEAMRFDNFQRGASVREQGGDRRLTMINLIREDVQSRRLVYENEEIGGWEHVQFLGEFMVRECPLVQMMTSDKAIDLESLAGLLGTSL